MSFSEKGRRESPQRDLKAVEKQLLRGVDGGAPIRFVERRLGSSTSSAV